MAALMFAKMSLILVCYAFWFGSCCICFDDLLRVSLPQIDEDVQRHNELLEVIKAAPSEVSQIVSRRRKDFTQEFFEHLHTVAESYYNDPAKQDGETN